MKKGDKIRILNAEKMDLRTFRAYSGDVVEIIKICAQDKHGMFIGRDGHEAYIYANTPEAWEYVESAPTSLLKVATEDLEKELKRRKDRYKFSDYENYKREIKLNVSGRVVIGALYFKPDQNYELIAALTNFADDHKL